MKKFLILTFIVSGCMERAEAQDTLWWKPKYILSADDYKSKPKSSDHGAVTYVGISYRFTVSRDSLMPHVFSYFLPSRSWIKSADKALLEHEQGHFDIAELFARKLKIAFTVKDLKTNSAAREYKSIFNRIKKEKDEMIAVYDKETEFSRNKFQQQVWNAKIKRELSGLEHYANK